MIDWDRISEMHADFGAEDFDEIVTLFLEEVETSLSALASDAQSPQRTEAHMHALKGSALNMGFSQLAGLAAKGEKQAAEGSADIVSPSDIQTCFEQSKKVFLDGLATRFQT